MHDIDRVRLESQFENEQYEQYGAAPLQAEQFEYDEAEYESPYGEYEAVFKENDEMELASDLLEVADEAELDQFLGKLMRRASQSVGSFIRSPEGRSIGGMLKNAARRVLPGIGSSLGGYLGGTRGAQFGGQVANAAGTLFGLELEGLSGEDQEFEVARRFVRFSGEALKNLAQSPQGQDPQGNVRNAIISAARQYAPGLLQPQSPVAPASGRLAPQLPTGGAMASSGRWTRRGNKIILHGM